MNGARCSLKIVGLAIISECLAKAFGRMAVVFCREALQLGRFTGIARQAVPHRHLGPGAEYQAKMIININQVRQQIMRQDWPLVNWLKPYRA
jgi:hypothetical protein